MKGDDYVNLMQPPCVVVNVSGRRFELNLPVVKSIPLLYTMLHDCTTFDPTGAAKSPLPEIYVARSPLLFEHVLALAYDNQYKCPSECHRELDFFLMERNDEYQCETERRLARLETLSATQHDSLLMAVLNAEAYSRKFLCRIKGCDQTVKNLSKCYKHSEHCIVTGCKERTQNNYCVEHAKGTRVCNIGKCVGRLIGESKDCQFHTYYCRMKST